MPPRLTPTLLTIGWPARSSRRGESACHTNGAWPYCAGGMGDTSYCGPPRGSRKRAGKRKKRRAGRWPRSGGCVVLNPAFMLRCTFAPKRSGQSTGCPFRKSYPDVVVVQPGQDWDGDNGTGALDRPTQGRILVQRQVRADLIVIRRISMSAPRS